MMLLHSKLARESCALKNETLPHALQGEGDGEGDHCSGTRAGTAFPALYDTGPL